MALGEWSLLTWKSKIARQKEQEEYAQWAFPHGQKQRDGLEALMRDLNPREKLQFMLMGFLTCKELYERCMKNTGSSDTAIDILINVDKKYKQIIKKKEMTMYLALVLVDSEIDDKCDYPSTEDVRLRIQELEKLRRKR